MTDLTRGRRFLAAGRIALLVVLLPGPSVGAAEDVAEPRVSFVGDTRILDAPLAGRVRDHVVTVGADGRPVVWLLVAPPTEDAESISPDSPEASTPEPSIEPALEALPRQLLRLQVGEHPSLVLTRDDLPSDTRGLDAFDLDGDGDPELLLLRPDGIHRIEPEGGTAPVRLLESEDVHWSAIDSRAVAMTMHVGGATLHGPSDEPGHWPVLADVDLPVKGRLTGGALRIRQPLPEAIGVDDEGRLFMATHAERVGARRVRTVVLAVPSGGDVSVIDAWGRLPEAEHLLGRHSLWIDGRPMLLLETKLAAKLELFGEKRLRLFELRHDRTRLGFAPVFATTSRMNLWQDASPVVVDVNGDDRPDLVVGYWKGLTGPKVVLDAYLRREDGSFDPSPRTTSFDVKHGDRSMLLYGEDVDGDNRPDLLLRTDEELRLHRGLASRRGTKLVERDGLAIPFAAATPEAGTTTVGVSSSGDVDVHVDSGGAEPRLADLDGDSRKEIYAIVTGERPQVTVFRVVWPEFE